MFFRPGKLKKMPQKKSALEVKSHYRLFSEILYLDELYEGTLKNYLRIFSGITKNTAIIGHYPEVKDLGNWLCGNHLQNFPVAGMMHLRISSDQIVNISAGQGKLLRFEYPEMFET